MANKQDESVYYRGEGICNLVLANEKKKEVYRIMKSSKYSSKENITEEQDRSKRIHQSLEDNVEYIKNIMIPLLTESFVAIPKITEIPKGFTERIEEEIKHIRTAHKRVRHDDFRTVDPATCSALVLPDFCYVTDMSTHTCISTISPHTNPTISVEIKPKKGFIPSSAMTSESSSGVKMPVCKFCMHQRLKAKEGRWSKTSHYCPLDLYSGNRSRMRHALHGLCLTPQNNLKICQDGVEVYSEFSKRDLGKILQQFFGDSTNGLKNGLRKQQELQTFVELIIDALLYVPKRCESQISHSSQCVQHRGSCRVLQSCDSSPSNLPTCDSSGICPKSNPSTSVQYCMNSTYQPREKDSSEQCGLPRDCVLERVLRTQMLDQHDIDAIHPLYVKIKQHLEAHPEERHWNLYGPFTAESWLLPCLDDSRREEDLSSIEHAVNQVKRHNVSKTAQDCSIMVALQRLSTPINSENLEMVLTDKCGRKYQFSVVIIDVDPKPVDKIKKYHEQQSNIVRVYSESQLDNMTG